MYFIMIWYWSIFFYEADYAAGAGPVTCTCQPVNTTMDMVVVAVGVVLLLAAVFALYWRLRGKAAGKAVKRPQRVELLQSATRMARWACCHGL